MKCSFKSISGENVVVLNSNMRFIYKVYFKMPIFGDELHAISGSSVIMYPPRAVSTRLVLLTFAAGSDVSLVVKHKI